MIRIRGIRRACAACARSASRSTVRPLSLALAAAVALMGCAAGPDFRTPAAPDVPAYTSDPVPASTISTDAPTGDAQQFLDGAPVPERWWTTFTSDELDRRVDQALAHSPTVASAQAALRQAQENVNATRGSLFPSVDANVGAQRGNTNFFGELAPGQSVFNLYNAGVNVNYTLDLFGGVRRGIEAAVGAGRFPAVPARRHVLEPRRERGDDELSRSVIARTDQGHRGNHHGLPAAARSRREAA